MPDHAQAVRAVDPGGLDQFHGQGVQQVLPHEEHAEGGDQTARALLRQIAANGAGGSDVEEDGGEERPRLVLPTELIVRASS
ncbi:hypothetical protein [Kitasatospora purpeofusca]|uniref:hypothetical protein n=1 Tax=Kitasatospora purpeofusca TaxID=67352 RepID=UPI003828BCD5